MTTPIVPMQGGPAPRRGGTQRGMHPMTPDDLESLSGLIDTTTHEGVDACVCVCSHRVTSSASPGRHEP